MKYLIPILLLISLGCSNATPLKPKIKVVIEGDSYSTTGDKWPLFLRDSSYYFKNIEQINYAVSGQQAYQMKDQYMTEAHTSHGQWFFIYAGINDLAGASRSADSIYSALKYIWSSAKKDGYKVVAFTVIHSLYLNASKEAERVKLNKLILSNHIADYIIDVASVFDPRKQPELFADKTHLNIAGFRMFAGVIARKLQR